VVCLWIAVHECTERQIDIYFLKAVAITTAIFLLFLYDWTYINERNKLVRETMINKGRIILNEKKTNPILILIKVFYFSYGILSINSESGSKYSVFILLHVIWIRYLQFAWCHCDCTGERESLSLSNIIENKCSIISPTRKKEKTRALVLKQIRLLFVSLWEKRHERRGKCRAKTYNNCERFMLIVLFAPSPPLSTSCRTSKSFTLLNDDYHPHAIYNEIHGELLSSSGFFFE
jgi:hypothetical protein